MAVIVRRRSPALQPRRQANFSSSRPAAPVVLFTMADVEAQYANFGPVDDAKRQADTFMRKTKKGGISIVRKGKRLAGRAKSAIIGDTWLGTGVRAAGLGAAVLARKPIIGAGKRAGLLALGAGSRAGGAAGGFVGNQYRRTLQAGARTSRDIGRAASEVPGKAASVLENLSNRVRGTTPAPPSAPRSAPRVINID